MKVSNLMKHLLLQMFFFLHWKNPIKLNNAACMDIPPHSQTTARTDYSGTNKTNRVDSSF